MPEFSFQSEMPAEARELFLYHQRTGAFERLLPPWENIRVLERQGGIEEGGILKMKIRKGPVTLTWIAEHGQYIEGQQFRDTQIKGPFKKWEHVHRFIPVDHEHSTLSDRIHYALPFGSLLGKTGVRHTENMLRKLFYFRHRRTYNDLMRHKAFAAHKKQTFVIVYRLVWKPGDRFLVKQFFGEAKSHGLEEAHALIHTGLPYAGRNPCREDAYDYLDYLRTALGTMGHRIDLLLHIRPVRHWLGRDTSGPGIDFHSAEAHRKARENQEKMLDPIRPYFEREVSIHLGNLIRPPMGYLVNLLLELETLLFLEHGAASPTFSWISREDALGAIQHVLFHGDIRGDLAAVTPEPASRAALQQVLIRKRFFGYAFHRLLKVLPWSGPGKPAEVEPELRHMLPISQTGFRCLLPDLEGAIHYEFGDIALSDRSSRR